MQDKINTMSQRQSKEWVIRGHKVNVTKCQGFLTKVFELKKTYTKFEPCPMYGPNVVGQVKSFGHIYMQIQRQMNRQADGLKITRLHSILCYKIVSFLTF